MHLRTIVALFESSILPIGLIFSNSLIELVFYPVLVALITSKGVVLFASAINAPWLRYVLSWLLPFLVIPVLVFFLLPAIIFQLVSLLEALPLMFDTMARALAQLLPIDESQTRDFFNIFIDEQRQIIAQGFFELMADFGIIGVIIYAIVAPYLAATLSVESFHDEEPGYANFALPVVSLGSLRVDTRKIADAADQILSDFARVLVLGVLSYALVVSLVFMLMDLNYGDCILDKPTIKPYL